MAKVEFLLKSKICDINFKELIIAKEEYFELLECNKFPKPPSDQDHYTMIKFLKRKDENNPIKIGAYKNITPFEAANRIGSDLVIFNGLFQLIEKNKDLQKAKFDLRLGNMHEKGKGDFTIRLNRKDYEGEAFNVAPSFLKEKLRKTVNGWKNRKNKLNYIFINDDAFADNTFETLDDRITKVTNYHKKPL